jgi:uncharacterized protein (DUF302 family)
MAASSYKFSVTLKGIPFDAAVQRVLDELKKVGFGLLRDIDVQATMKAKLNITDHPPYRILGMCNPQLAHRALQIEPDIGVFLPCNVVVRQEQDDVIVTFADPEKIMSVIDDPSLLSEMVHDAKPRLLQAQQALSDSATK